MSFRRRLRAVSVENAASRPNEGWDSTTKKSAENPLFETIQRGGWLLVASHGTYSRSSASWRVSAFVISPEVTHAHPFPPTVSSPPPRPVCRDSHSEMPGQLEFPRAAIHILEGTEPSSSRSSSRKLQISNGLANDRLNDPLCRAIPWTTSERHFVEEEWHEFMGSVTW